MTRRYLPTLFRGVALAATWTVIGIHIDLVNDHLEETPYLGVLFVVAAALLIPVVHALSRSMSAPALVYGSVVNAGLACGFLLSRTTGLPGAERETWTSDHVLGLTSLAAELTFLAACVAALNLGRDRELCATGHRGRSLAAHTSDVLSAA